MEAGVADHGRHVTGSRWAASVVLLGVFLTATVLVVASLAGGAADPTALSDPGPLTRWGLLVSRTAYDLSMIGTLGLLLVAVALLPRTAGELGEEASRLVRRASWWAAVWCVTAVLTALLTMSQIAGVPVLAALAPDVLPLAMDLEQTRSLLSSAWLVGLVAVGARLSTSPVTGLLLLLTAGGALILPLLTGHAGHGPSQVLTATSLSLHVAAAAAWVGGLGALAVHLRRSHATLATCLPRYSQMALACFVAVGLSGVVTGWATLATLDQLWTTPYGRLLLAKVAALAVLGAFGHQHRRRSVAAVVARRPRAFLTLAAAELILMACAAALAVALSNTATPPTPDHAGGEPTAVVIADAVV